MKKHFLFLLTTLMSASMMAQYPVVTIQDIQFVDPMDLANCIDKSSFLANETDAGSGVFIGDTVITHGTVVMDGGLAQATDGRNVWIQNGTGPFSGIDVYASGGISPDPIPGTDVIDLLAGDSIEITAIVGRFGNETELIPLAINVVDFDRPVHITPASVEDLNDDNQVNQLETGEEIEGSFVEFYNVTVTDITYFSGGNRVSFQASDAAGNAINVSDRFLVQRLPANGGNFVPPTTTTIYDTLRGVIAHSGNGCTGGNGRGYELYPFDESHYVVQQGAAPPQISSITRNPLTPTSSQDVNVSATVVDPDGSIASASLWYAVGLNNNNYLEAPMTNSGSTYTGTIPNTAFSDGDIVKYYLCAEDNDGLTACNPDVPAGNFEPIFFTVRDNGITIYDLQYTPFDDGNSPYRGLDVTIQGIVTASAQANDLGYVYIQDPNFTEWAGIGLVEGDLTNLKRGDLVEVSGVVEENFTNTRMSVTGSPTVISSGNPLPAPAVVDPNDLTDPTNFLGAEPFESMVITLANPGSGGIFVVEKNADGPNNNFAEYRVGSDPFDFTNGSRVLAGRQTGSAFSSLWFSYINDSTFILDNGVINTDEIDVCVVNVGDTMNSMTGILTYTFGNYKLLPRNNADMNAFSGANCPEGVSTDLAEGWEENTLSIFPNPANEQVQVVYNFLQRLDGQVELLDLTGRSLSATALRGYAGTLNISTSAVPAGTYVLRFTHQNELIGYEKLIITH